MTIDQKATKAEIITASTECIDYQQSLINRLQQQQPSLFIVIGILSVYSLLF